MATVWQASNYPFDSSYLEPDDPYTWKEEGHWELWYPGDEAVDWVGMSYFYGANSFEDQWGCNMDAALDGGEPPVILNSLLDFARERRKPVMIAEAAPTAYDLEENTVACMPVTSCGSIITSSVAKGLRLA